jgi:hypothetical protein
MDNQNFKGMISALEKVSGEHARLTGSLLDELNWLTDKIYEIIKNNELHDKKSRFDYKNYGYRYIQSNVGGGIWLCSNLNSEHESKLLPSSTKDLGSERYLHHDFNCQITYMNREDVLKFCEILPEFVQNIISKIQSLSDNEQKALETISKIQIAS